MGHIAHLRKQFKSTNTYNHNVDNYFPLEKGGALHLKKKLESSSPKVALYEVWLKLANWFLRRRFFFNFVNFIFVI